MDKTSGMFAGNNNSDFFYKIANEKAHTAVTASSCILSVLGCFIIFATYIKWKDIRSTSRRILVFITICDIITTASYLAGLFTPDYSNNTSNILNNDKQCLAVGLVSTFSMIASFLWTFSLATYLYIAIVIQDVRFADRLVIVYHMFCWGIPLVVTVIAGVNGVIGFDEDFVTSGWCWVKVSSSKHKPQLSTLLWMLLAGKGWEILSFVAISVIYFLIRYNMWLQLQDKTAAMPRSSINLINRANRKMTWIPLVFLFLRIWGTIRFLLYATGVATLQGLLHTSSGRTLGIILLYLQGIGDCGQGWANCILFCLFTNKVHERIKTLCCKPKIQHIKHSNRKKSKHPRNNMTGVVSSETNVTSNHHASDERSPLING